MELSLTRYVLSNSMKTKMIHISMNFKVMLKEMYTAMIVGAADTFSISVFAENRYSYFEG